MDQTPRKRGLWGSFSLFGRKQPDAESKDENTRPAVAGGATRVGLGAQEPESPAKRATDTQLQGRKILGRPQGPSSKLVHALNASDFTQLSTTPPKSSSKFSVPDDDSNPPSPVSEKRMPGDMPGKIYDRRIPSETPGKTYPRTGFGDSTWKSSSAYERISGMPPGSTAFKPRGRMPGDNPNKFSTFAPSRSAFSASTSKTNFSGAATTPRNMFRDSAMKRPSIYSFSPNVPANTLKHKFPQNTPGKAPRGATPEINGRSLRQDDTQELFDLQIPAPPEHLSGETLSKEVPEDNGRVGSIYADQFLAHYCPDDFDDLQRRQFFCVLDLRRLKYAADEIFAKKDWKINIVNFAKEYEKNRSLIMLRYGLYEFKTVRATEAVKKEWKQKHGIVDSDDEETQAVAAYKPNNAGSKRKAQDDLQAKDTALTASSTNLNKRARAENVPQSKASDSNKNKRKASVSEADENHPAKLSKPSTPAKPPSLTRSIFESVANSPGAASGPAVKPAQKKSGLSSSVTAMAVNGTSQSVFDSGAKPTITHNIFGQLSDTSKGSGNDDADAETDSDSDADADADPESEEVQEASQSEEPSVVASGGVATPQFGGLLRKTNGASSASSDAGEGTKTPSLFDRVAYGKDGQPIRASQQEIDLADEPTASSTRSASPAKEARGTPLPTSAPANNTWSTNTPIKFAPTAPSGTAATPASSLFSAAPKTAPAAPISFGAPVAKKDDATTTPAAPEAPKPAFPSAGASLFGNTPSKTSAAPSLFGATPKTETASSLFGAASKTDTASSLFGASAKPSSSAPIQFGSMPAFGQAKATEKPAEAAEKGSEAPAAATTPLFGSKAPGTGSAATPSVFQSSTLFGGAPKSDTPATASASNLFKSIADPAAKVGTSASSLFSSPAPKRSADAEESKPAASTLFSSTPAQPVPASSLFGGNNASKPTGSLFGATPAQPATAVKDSISDRPIKKAVGRSTASLFASSTATPSLSFGAKPSTTPTASPTKPQVEDDTAMASPDAGKKGAASTIGGSSGPSNGTFGFGSNAAPSTASTFSFGGGPQSTATSFNFGGASTQPSAAQPASQSFTAPGSTFSFTAGGSTNPFSQTETNSTGTASAPGSFAFGSNTAATTSAPSSFTFGSNPTAGGSTPATFNFGATSNPSAPATSFGFGGDSKPADNGGASSPFLFGSNPGGAATPTSNGGNIFAFGGPNQGGGTGSIFGQHLAPVGGTSTGTNSPFTFGGASSLATTPATGTPEPGTENEDAQAKKAADGDDGKQAQISLTEGGPGEEDEVVVHEVRTKALKLVTKGEQDDEDDDESNKDKSPWKVQGVGPLRILKHKTTGAVRMLLRAEPRGSIAMNKAILPQFTYKPEATGGKYVKVTTSNTDGSGLETWMLQVKTPAAAKELADALEANKDGEKK